VPELVDVVLTPLARLATDSVGRLHLHLLARIVLSGRRLEWSSRWFSLAPWTELLRAARPDLTERQAADRWWLAFELLLQVFGDPQAPTPREPRIPMDTVRGFVIAGLDAP
jgi:hypothetical protein